MRVRDPKRRAIVLLLVFAVLVVLVVIPRKYIWLYLSRTTDPRPPVADLLRDPEALKSPELLLAEANRLAWLFNWPKAEPLYARAEELFKKRGDTRNEIYARVGRIRAQAETMSWVDVSEVLGKQLEIPVVKSDQRLRLWCLAAKGYTDLEINPVSAKRAWIEAQRIAQTLGEAKWEARAKGELGFIAFLEGDSRRAAIMVGDAFLSAKASGDVGGQVEELERARTCTIWQTPQQLLIAVNVETLVRHYREHELPDIFHERKPNTASLDEGQKTYSTQYAYEIYIKSWILPRWRSYRLADVKAVDVEAWLKILPLARGTKAKIRNIMSALFAHAIRWEWTEKNPITSVRQSAKRSRTPDVLTPEEINALLSKLPEPPRTAAELDAFTGLRRGELIGLQWQDVDFDKLVIHVRRSVVMMVEGTPKTEASAKDVPLDSALAESLKRFRDTSAYKQPTNWVFASPRMKGKQPWWTETLWRRYGKPAVDSAKISKRVGFHTFRHTYTTLLTQNNEDVKVVQELLRHANSRITLDLYAQAGMPEKRLAQSKVVRMVLDKKSAVV